MIQIKRSNFRTSNLKASNRKRSKLKTSNIKRSNLDSIFNDRAERHGLNHGFGYHFLLSSSLLKKRGKKKRKMNSKNRDFKSCLSTRSF